MVFVVLSRTGFSEVEPRLDPKTDAVWVSEGVLSEPELCGRRARGWNITNFVHRVTTAELAGDLETVRQHHPDDVIWIEAHPA